MTAGANVETRYGLSAPAFQLTPDPAFYFDNGTHAEVLAKLEAGVRRAEGFIVVSAEAGMGKTLLVKALLERLDGQVVEAAHIVVTPAGRRDVLTQALTAFGVPARGGNPAQQIAALEAFLLTLTVQGRRALLIVDEAQGLDREALEELRTLTNLQIGNQSLIQVFLLGQPDLARLLNSRAMEQLRQRVLAFCRLQPLSGQDTRLYIEHRLRCVGWRGVPAFEPDAHLVIHHWSEGVPRRINALCNRLLLAACLVDTELITAELAEQAADDLDAERRRALPAVAQKAAPAWQMPQAQDDPLQQPPLMCVAATRMDVLMARTLAAQMRETPGAPSLLLVVEDGSALTQGKRPERREPPAAWLELPMGLEAAQFPRNMSEALRRMDALLEVIKPCGVFLLGDSELDLACALVARRRNLPLARLQAGLRANPHSGHAALIERLTQLNLVPHAAALAHLHAEGLTADTGQVVGSLALSLLQHAAEQGWNLAEAWRHSGATASGLTMQQPYTVAAVRIWPDDPWPVDTADVLRGLATVTQVVWLLDDASEKAMGHSGFAADMQREGIHVLHRVDELDVLALLSNARALMHDAGQALATLAESMGLPLLHFDALDQARHQATLAASAVVEDGEEAAKALKHILLQAESRPRSARVQPASQAAALIHTWVSLSQDPLT